MPVDFDPSPVTAYPKKLTIADEIQMIPHNHSCGGCVEHRLVTHFCYARILGERLNRITDSGKILFFEFRSIFFVVKLNATLKRRSNKTFFRWLIK
jgi:hypothetical protein